MVGMLIGKDANNKLGRNMGIKVDIKLDPVL